jgi:hypothetical protein
MKNRLRNAKSATWLPTACRRHAFGWVSTRRDGCSDFNGPKSFGIPILVFGLFLLLSAAQAKQYAIDWFTIDGGGGTSTGGV